MNKVVIYLALAALAIVPSLSTAAVGPGAINVVNFAFQDASTGLQVTVASGGATFTDVSGVHTVTASDGSFDSGPLEPGQAFSPDIVGPAVVQYSCAFHPSMRGVLAIV